MSAGVRFCQAGVWTTTHDMPSFGFVYLTNAMFEALTFQWRAYIAALPFYSEGAIEIPAGEQKTIIFGLPTAWVHFEVKSPIDAVVSSG